MLFENIIEEHSRIKDGIAKGQIKVTRYTLDEFLKNLRSVGGGLK